jgi:hypothetical protein
MDAPMIRSISRTPPYIRPQELMALIVVCEEMPALE